MHSWMETMMKNYEVLHNFPEELLNYFKIYWKENKDSVEIIQRFIYKRADYLPNVKNVLNLEYNDITALIGPANIGITEPHIDSSRLVAMSIPIDVDLKNSFFYTDKVGKEEWVYVEEDCDHYNLEKPCIVNTKVPHGYANFADTDRVILSVTFGEHVTYEELLERLPREWF